jgi:hypothetical protein
VAITFERARKIIDVEFKDKSYIPGDVRLYKFVLLLFEDDNKKADAFMTSAFGGYTKGELNSIKYQIDRNKTVYMRQKLERA